MFPNREAAAKRLAIELIKRFDNIKDGIVIGIPAGGVVIGYYIARELNLPLDIVISRKIATPYNKEVAIAAVSQDGSIILNRKIKIDIYKDYIEKELQKQRIIINNILKELKNTTDNLHSLRNKKVILTDDGIATGMTVLAAIKFIEKQAPKKIILAIPVASKDTIIKLKRIVDYCLCLEEVDKFFSVAQFYEDFRQIRTEEVKTLLRLTR